MGTITVVNENGAEVATDQGEPKSPEGIVGHISEELELKAIGDVIGLDEGERTRYQDKLQTLRDYAKAKTNDHSHAGLKWAIRDLELKLNTPTIGEKMIDYIHRFAYLELESMKIQKEKEKFYGTI